MKVTQKITLDMARPLVTPPVNVKQGDTNTRRVELALYMNGAEWTIPTEATPILRYRKADGTSGMYDTLPDGTTPAATAAGNVLTINLAPQMLTFPGPVPCDVALVNGMEVLSTFNFLILVERSPAAGTDTSSQSYYKVQSLDELNALLEEFEQKIRGSLVAQPIPVTSAAEMTDPGTIYLYLGSETGYSYGYVYVRINGAWISIGMYSLPGVTTADAGKFMRVSSAGIWAAETVTAAEGVSF